jgi:LmbE family N-acetylglucosaminyl deacetylase
MWVYLSPHFDDAVLSVGGLIWEQTRAGEIVEIWTVCAGEPPAGVPLSAFAQSLHARWGGSVRAVEMRRAEDRSSCRRIGARPRHFNLPDAIYRIRPDGRALIEREEDLQTALPEEQAVVDVVAAIRKRYSPRMNLVSPLAIGGHVDHRLTRMAAERLGVRPYYYADYPYVAANTVRLADYIHPDWEEVRWVISTQGLEAWQAAIAEHRSQISTFWQGVGEMKAAIADYWGRGGGSILWLAK